MEIMSSCEKRCIKTTTIKPQTDFRKLYILCEIKLKIFPKLGKTEKLLKRSKLGARSA